MKIIRVIFGALIYLMGFYVVVTTVLIVFGWTETPFSEIKIPFFIILGLFIFKAIRISKERTAQTAYQKINSDKETKKTITEKPYSTLIVTASEDVCSTLANTLNSHSLVIDTYEDSGFWYSNGETGPEWFTVNIRADYKNKEEIEKLVEEHSEDKIFNMYWS